jgi:hypothetical protein
VALVLDGRGAMGFEPFLGRDGLLGLGTVGVPRS